MSQLIINNQDWIAASIALEPSTFQVYLYLASIGQREIPYSALNNAHLAQVFGFGDKTAKRAKSSLKKAKYLILQDKSNYIFSTTPFGSEVEEETEIEEEEEKGQLKKKEIENSVTQETDESDFELYPANLFGGIYGIYKDDELIYIGYTARDFESRFEEHKTGFMMGMSASGGQKSLYSLAHWGKDNITFSPLIKASEICATGLTARDIKAMELGLITLYKPKGNTIGVEVPYTLS